MSEKSDQAESSPLLPDKSTSYFVNKVVKLVDEKFPGWIKKLDSSDSANIISVGCGRGIEPTILGRRFPKSKVWGIDIDTKANADANWMIRVMDGTNPKSYVDENGNEINYELVVIRSPQISDDKPDSVWTRIIDQVDAHLKPDGLVYCTLNNGIENDAMKSVLIKKGFDVYEFKDSEARGKNASAFNENYILIAKKSSGSDK